MCQPSQQPQSLRCHAKSKRSGRQCQRWAVEGKRVCYYHGAGGGGPLGPRNGMWRHGLKTNAAIAERKAVRAMLREMRAVMVHLS